MKKILVTGGAGYVGSVTVELMVTQGLEVVVLDNLAEGHADAVPHHVPLLDADLTDRDATRNVFSKFEIDSVIHLAALALVEESVREPALYYRNNVAGFLTLLDTMVEFDVKKIIFSSSAAVYGVPDEVPIREGSPLLPVNPYGETKLIGERILEDYFRAYGLASVSLRYFNVAGASAERGEHHRNESHLVPRVLQVALGLRPHVEIYGTDYATPDGTCIRDYIHVLDVAQAHVLALHHTADGTIATYNLGNSKGYSVREVISCAEAVAGKKIPAVEYPRRPGDPPSLVASFEKISQQLGWQPKRSKLKQIIESAWHWHSRYFSGYTR